VSRGDELPISGAPWALDAREVLRALDVTPEEGLRAHDVARRRERHGPNRLREVRRQGAAEILVRQFRSLIMAILAVAAGVSLAFAEYLDAGAIAAVLLLNALLGFVAELRAVRSMEALRSLGRVLTRVRRDGEVREIDATELVPGDVVLLEGGDVVSADVRLFDASRLEADESTLTGESLPVAKGVEAVEDEAGVADRRGMLHKGTSVTRGAAEGVVVATGMETELGRIAELVSEAKEERTPLEERLETLARKLVGLTLVLAAIPAVAGILRGRELFLMIETAVALAVAAIPEGLPIVATIALARGMWRMARRHAIINRLSAVETLGSTDVIFTDKTGTLTENRLTVREVRVPSGEVEIAQGEVAQGEVAREAGPALEIGVLCNNAELEKEGESGVGDPLEVALLRAGRAVGLERRALLEERPRVREEAFDSTTRRMATVHRTPDGFLVAAKGAPETLVETCRSVWREEGEEPLDDDGRAQWLRWNEDLASSGRRVLAVARAVVSSAEASFDDDLALVGLIGLVDPPRREAAESVRACRDAGIRVIMVTGDHPETARHIAREVELVEDTDAPVVTGRELGEIDDPTPERREELREVSIFARLDPEQKLELIALHQDADHVVAMTGDGVNDAPALEKADIGVAMGQRGTQVAREAADMVLEDDAFASIVAAVRGGRIIFGNIRKFVVYLLSCNVSEILVVSVASAFDLALPLLPLQILFLNLVTDVFPALALALGEGREDVMRHRPRPPGEPILTRRHWGWVLLSGSVITVVVLAALVTGQRVFGFEEERAVTVSFLTLAAAQLWHVFNVRDAGSTVLRNSIVANPWVWGALGLCAGLLAIAVYAPGISDVLQTTEPGLEGWLLAAGCSVVPLAVGQFLLGLRGRGAPAPADRRSGTGGAPR